jgi:hypothetical protein
MWIKLKPILRIGYIKTMEPFAQMIVHNIAGIHSPEDTSFLVTYVTTVLQGCHPKINRAKWWHDCIFRSRYYYTVCPRTLDLLRSIKTSEMTRHVIMLESVVSFTTTYLLEVETILRRIINAGFGIVWTNQESIFTMDSYVAFKGGRVEIILEGCPFEQEYVTDLKAFHAWLDKRLPQLTYAK